jgi:hypothetical protein
MSLLGILASITVILTVVVMALPTADNVLADPMLRFALIVTAMALLTVILLRALYPLGEVRYEEAVELSDAPEPSGGVVEKDWLTLYIELRSATRRRLEVRHRMSREELEAVLASDAAWDLVKDQKVMDLLTCDLKKLYLWPGADLEATFVDLLRRVERIE